MSLEANQSGEDATNGALLSCGCWTWWGILPGQAVGDHTECETHGYRTFILANVSGPRIPQTKGRRFFSMLDLYGEGKTAAATGGPT